MHDHLLRAAFNRLGLAPGASWSEIVARYRHLAKLWHPDRFPKKSDKDKAEEILKQIIDAKEMLQAHFLSEIHMRHGPCPCWARASPNSEAHAKPKSYADAKAKSEGGQGTAEKPKSKPRQSPLWAWVDDICKYLDIGPMAADEPPWFESFRRMCDGILGKHPGDTLMDIWGKAPTWTKEHKRKSLLIAIFITVVVDKIVACTAIANVPIAQPRISPQSLPQRSAQGGPRYGPPMKQRSAQGGPRYGPPMEQDSAQGRPRYGPPVELESANEIRAEQRYFDQKWQEQDRLLQRIRPGFAPSP